MANYTFLIRLLENHFINGHTDLSLRDILGRHNDQTELDAAKDGFEYNTFVRRWYLDFISGLPENANQQR